LLLDGLPGTRGGRPVTVFARNRLVCVRSPGWDRLVLDVGSLASVQLVHLGVIELGVIVLGRRGFGL
jgi:hypothetical protein